MKNIQFDSLYKFIISIGLLIVIFPFSILYLFFKDNNTLLLPQKEILELTDVAQDILKTKQNMIIYLLSSWIFYIILACIFLFGIYLVVYGIKKWKWVQEQLDTKAELENEKLKQDLAMTEKEQRKKTEREIENDKELIGEHTTNLSVHDYMNVERMVAKKVKEDFLSTHDVIHGAKIGNREYDIVAIGKGIFEKDYIFEIKYIQRNINKRWLDDIIFRMQKAFDNYSESTNRLPYRMLIIVTNSDNYTKINEVITKNDNINDLSIKVIRREDIKNTTFHK